MITFTCAASMPDERLALMGLDPQDSVFFDIETTGFRASSSHLYMIGAAFRSAGSWTVMQWMGERPQEEAGLLRVFAEFLRPYGTIIHFNGARFDLPYMEEKYARYGLESPFASMRSVDIYRDCKCLRPLLGLDHMNQRSLERFLGLHREDLYDGGQLIKVYYDYVKTGNKDLEKLLLLHNCEDVKGMLLLTSLYTYLDLFSCRSEAQTPDDSAQPDPSQSPCVSARNLYPIRAEISDCSLIMYMELPYAFPVPLQAGAGPFLLSLNEKTAALSAAVLTGDLLFFFENFRDYYYLPAEDTAIHKSVASFVDPKYREPAKARTCYTKVNGCFLPQPEPAFTPAYKRSYDDTGYWFSMPEQAAENTDFLKSYASLLIRFFMP